MSAWFTDKVSSLVKDVPRLPAGSPQADEVGATLEQRARALNTPHSAAWLLNQWDKQCDDKEVLYTAPEKKDSKAAEVWHLTFYQVLLRTSAFEGILDTCARVPTLRAALANKSDDPESDQLRRALRNVAGKMLLPGAIQLWPVLLEALLAEDDGSAPLPWGSWARRLLGSLKRDWRNEALPTALRELDRQLTDSIMTNHAESVQFHNENSDMKLSGTGGQLSKRGIRVALVRRQMPQCASEAANLRLRTELLCEMCERLSETKGYASRKTAEVERLLADADVACSSLEPGMKDLEHENEDLNKKFGDVGSALQDQLTSVLLTQESFANRRKKLGDERDQIIKRLRDIDSEIIQLEQEAGKCGVQVVKLRQFVNQNTDTYDGLIGGSLCAQENMSGRKDRAAAFQECARNAVHLSRASNSKHDSDLVAQLRRRRGELTKLCADYVHKERLRLQLADECLVAASSTSDPGTNGEVGEDVAEAVSSAQDAWRRAQATLQRVDLIIDKVADDTQPVVNPAPKRQASEAIGMEGADASAEATVFFAREAAAGRRFCGDCAEQSDIRCRGAEVADWASVSLGIYLCMDCAGRHRGLGVHVSFVRSVNMDRWTKPQLQRMQQGGSARFREFLANYPELDGTLSSDAPEELLKRRYCSRAAAFYRQMIAAECAGGATGAAPNAGEGHLLADLATSADASGTSPGSGEGGGYERGQSPKTQGAPASLEEERLALASAYEEHQKQLQQALASGGI